MKNRIKAIFNGYENFISKHKMLNIIDTNIFGILLGMGIIGLLINILGYVRTATNSQYHIGMIIFSIFAIIIAISGLVIYNEEPKIEKVKN